MNVPEFPRPETISPPTTSTDKKRNDRMIGHEQVKRSADEQARVVAVTRMQQTSG